MLRDTWAMVRERAFILEVLVALTEKGPNSMKFVEQTCDVHEYSHRTSELRMSELA